MTFDDAIAYLDEHINLEKTTALAGRVEGLSLERMRALVAVLGEPQSTYPVIHLTGTNGKGSTARMISGLIDAHHLSVGTYTSPHLEHVTERIAWGLAPITPDAFAAQIEELASLEPLLGDRPSYFELLTAAAFAYFAEVAVDVAVVEVGLLGRWDATNVADARVAVVTNVGRDHTDSTGDWRRRIAEEKAGIITPGSHLVLGEADPELRAVFLAEGADDVWVVDVDFGCETDKAAIGGRVVDLLTPNGRIEELFLPVHGAHQADNAACAVAAVEAFFGRPIDADVAREAFARLTLPGRFEVVHRGPLVVLDGAHNPDGARAAAATLADEFDIIGTRHWVLGVLRGRDVNEMLDALGVRPGDRMTTCTPPSPRGLPADELAGVVSARGVAVESVPDVTDALAAAWAQAGGVARAGRTSDRRDSDAHAGDLVIVTGSIYTVGAARTACRTLGLLPS